MNKQAADFVTKYTVILKPIYKKAALKMWKASITGKKRYFQEYANLEKKISTLFSNKKEFRRVEGYWNNSREIADPLLKRQIKILYLNFKSNQGDKKLLKKIIDKTAELEQAFNIYRAVYKGKKATDNDLREILRKTRNSEEAKAVWKAGKQIGEEVKEKIIEVVRLRNQLARGLGYRDYYDMSFDLDELNEKEILELFENLEKATRTAFENVKKKIDRQLAPEFGISTSELRPWHYRDPFFQNVPPTDSSNLDSIFKGKKLEKLTRDFYDGIGLDIRPILEKSDLYEKPGKDQHAFCIGIENPHDVRVLCNLKSNEQWMGTMLHEFGHGSYDRYIDPSLPYFLRASAHTLTTESIALFFERLIAEPEFLEKMGKVPKQKARKMGSVSQKAYRERLLVFSRFCLVMVHFEKSLYANPRQNLNRLWWDLAEQYQLLKKPENRDMADWASKTHIATAPVYYHNYLLGEIHASQLIHHMKKTSQKGFHFIQNPYIGHYLKERIFRHGATLPWNERLIKTTGEPLNPTYFIQQVTKRK